MKRSRLSRVCALAIATAACGESVAEGDAVQSVRAEPTAEMDVAEIRRALEEVDARWERAANRGDAAGVAALYTDDGRLLPPNAEVAQGHEDIRAVIQGYIDAGMKNVDFTAVEVGAAGDLAYEVGRYSFDLQPPGTPDALTDHGKYVIVAQRQPDGEWKIVADIFNTSRPAQGGR